MCVIKPRRTRNVGVAKFLRYLFDLLNSENKEIIAWTQDGMAFEVFDAKRLEQEILPKYFNHSKITSFQRQLNYFGFRKWNTRRCQSKVWTFSHPYFARDQKDLLVLINRKKTKRKWEDDTVVSSPSFVEATEVDMQSMPEDPWEILFWRYEQDPTTFCST